MLNYALKMSEINSGYYKHLFAMEKDADIIQRNVKSHEYIKLPVKYVDYIH